MLGLVGYWKLWIDGHTKLVKFLYDKLVEQELLNWNEEDGQKLKELKEKLVTALLLSLSDLDKPFKLFINVEEGIAYGVLVQKCGGYGKPVAYVSKLLDSVVRGWPACLQSVAATVALVKELQISIWKQN